MPKLFNLEEDCLDVLSCREKEEFLLGEEKKGVRVGFKKTEMDQKRRAGV